MSAEDEVNTPGESPIWARNVSLYSQQKERVSQRSSDTRAAGSPLSTSVANLSKHYDAKGLDNGGRKGGAFETAVDVMRSHLATMVAAKQADSRSAHSRAADLQYRAEKLGATANALKEQYLSKGGSPLRKVDGSLLVPSPTKPSRQPKFDPSDDLGDLDADTYSNLPPPEPSSTRAEGAAASTSPGKSPLRNGAALAAAAARGGESPFTRGNTLEERALEMEIESPYRRRVVALEAQIGALQGQLNDRDRQAEDLRTRYKRKEAEAARLEYERKTLKTQNELATTLASEGIKDEYEREIRETQEENTKLREKVKDLEASMRSKEQQVKQANAVMAEVQVLRQDHAESQKVVAGQEAREAALLSAKSMLKKRSDILEQRLEELQAKLGAVQELSDDREREIMSLSKQLQVESTKAKEMKSENGVLMERMGLGECEIAALRGRCEETINATKELQGQLVEKENALAQMQASVEESITQQVRRQETREEQMRKQLREAESKVQELTWRLSDAQDTITALESTADKTNERIAEADKTVESLAAELQTSCHRQGAIGERLRLADERIAVLSREIEEHRANEQRHALEETDLRERLYSLEIRAREDEALVSDLRRKVAEGEAAFRDLSETAGMRATRLEAELRAMRRATEPAALATEPLTYAPAAASAVAAMQEEMASPRARVVMEEGVAVSPNAESISNAMLREELASARAELERMDVMHHEVDIDTRMRNSLAAREEVAAQYVRERTKTSDWRKTLEKVKKSRDAAKKGGGGGGGFAEERIEEAGGPASVEVELIHELGRADKTLAMKTHELEHTKKKAKGWKHKYDKVEEKAGKLEEQNTKLESAVANLRKSLKAKCKDNTELQHTLKEAGVLWDKFRDDLEERTNELPHTLAPELENYRSPAILE